jgi:hypothetical protein
MIGVEFSREQKMVVVLSWRKRAALELWSRRRRPYHKARMYSGFNRT